MKFYKNQARCGDWTHGKAERWGGGVLGAAVVCGVYLREPREARVRTASRERVRAFSAAACASVRRWKDRKVMLDLPLFPGYVFVRMALRNRLHVQQVPGVAHLVGFDGTPAALPDQEIDALRASLSSGVRAENRMRF